MKRTKKLYLSLLILLVIATLSVLLFVEKSASQVEEKAVGGNSLQSGNVEVK